jgi:AcrR family transcriptional regulator
MPGRAAATRPLPRGPHNLTRDDVLTSQRERMLDAIAEVVARKGYANATVGDVVSGAGVSRKTFYEHFGDKEDCFLAAFDSGVETLLAAIVAADPAGPGRIERIRVRMRAYLRTLADNPAFARTFLIEVFAAGPRALQRRAEVHARFEQMIHGMYEETRRELPELPQVPDAIPAAAVGAFNELVTKHVREGRTGDLPELEDALVHIQVSLFAGPMVADSLGLEEAVRG